jgi:predicted DCC family thiol-disulfide oxidoreductase YuxK
MAHERQEKQLTVIYDGHCGVCTRLANRVARLDTHGVLEIVPSQAAGVRERFPWISANAYDESLQVVRTSDNRTWEGAAAVEEVVRTLRAGWVVSWLFRIPFARRIAERGYRWFADHRGELGCGDHCQVHKGLHTASPAVGTKNS